MRALMLCMLVILCSHSLSGCLRTSGEVSSSPMSEPDQGLPELDQDSTELDQDPTEPDQDSPEPDQGLLELDQDLPELDRGSPEPEFRGHRLSSPLSQYELEPGEAVEIEIIYEATSEEGDIVPLEGQRLEIMWTSALSDVPPDLVTTSVGASEVITDATGRARFTVTGGEVYELVRISASDPQRPEVTAVAWDMIVRGDPIPELITDLNIELTYDEGSGRYQAETLHGAQVSLFEDLSCGDLDISALPEPLYALPELRPYQRLDHVFTIDELRPESSLSVVAVITNEDLVPIAVGCADRVEASSGSTIVLPLRDLPEMLRPSYHAVHRLNFLETSLATEAFNTLQLALRVVRMIAGSGEQLTEEEYITFCSVASNDSLTCYYIFNSTPASISRLGDELSPAAREAMLRIGGIIELITTLALKSELRLYPQPLLTDDIANVEHEWRAVSFDRDVDCDEPCNEELTLEEIGLSPVNTDFRMLVSAERVLEIFPHEVVINLGDIALAIIERFIIPQTMSESLTLQDFFLENLLATCPDLDRAVGASNMTCLQSFAGRLTNHISVSLGELNQLGNLSLNGTVTPVNLDSTPEIERLEGGQWSATNDISDLTGCFNACDQPECVYQSCE